MGVTTGDLAIIAGFIVFAIAAFWLVGRAADRGLLAGPTPAMSWAAITAFCIIATYYALMQEWVLAALWTTATFLQIADRLRRRRAPR